MKGGYWIAGGVALVAVVAVVVVVVGFLLLSGGQERPATVIEAVNKVDAHPHSQDDWQPAAKDMAIYGGGQVRTGAASSARLELLEGMVRLSAESLFTVKESTTRQGKLVTTLFLQEGRLWANLTTSQPHELTVDTGSAVAAVRDTRFSVMVDPDQATWVSVAEGAVTLTAQGKSVTVTAGQQATVAPGQPPGPPQPMSDEERVLWATEGEMPQLAPSKPTPTPTVTPLPTDTPLPTQSPTPRATSTPVPTNTPERINLPAPTSTPPPTATPPTVSTAPPSTPPPPPPSTPPPPAPGP